MQQALTTFSLPPYREIPDVGLYLDQTVKYVNRAVQPLGVQELTPSMVSNYVKKKYIANPVCKQYGPDQLARLIVIAVSKTVLGMEDLAVICDVGLWTERPFCEIYEQYRVDLQSALRHTFGCGEEALPPVPAASQAAMIRSLNTAVANVLLLKDSLRALREDPSGGIPSHHER